jgi:Immunity protein 35
MISREAAELLAGRYLRDEVEPDVGQEVAIASIREFPSSWVIGYNTRAFLETRSIRYALAGGGPLIIDKQTGELSVGTSALPVERQVEGDEILCDNDRCHAEDE